MDNKLDQLKKDLVQEIKDLAQSIATSDSYIGLLSNEIKFRTLQEKFIVLKFLEQRKLSLDVFDLPILTQDEKREVLEHEGFFEDEQPVIFDFDVKNEEETEEDYPEEKEEITEELLDEEIEEVLKKAEELEEVNKYLIPEDNNDSTEERVEEEPEESSNLSQEIFEEPEEEIEEEEFENNLEETEYSNELFDSISYDDTVPPENKIKEISLDFNDKIGFLNQLFLGDEESMNLVINTLNRISDVRSSNMYLDDLKREMNWNEEQEEYFERLKELVLKRFD